MHALTGSGPGAFACTQVRLRYSVTFTSARQRMLQYVLAPPKPHLIPLIKRTYRTNATFAKRGQGETHSYDWDVLMLYVDELKLLLRDAVGLIAALEDALLWRRASMHRSVLALAWWQVRH